MDTYDWTLMLGRMPRFRRRRLDSYGHLCLDTGVGTPIELFGAQALESSSKQLDWYAAFFRRRRLGTYAWTPMDTYAWTPWCAAFFVAVAAWAPMLGHLWTPMLGHLGIPRFSAVAAWAPRVPKGT